MESFFISFFSPFVNGPLLDDLIRQSLVLPLGFTFLGGPLLLTFSYYVLVDSVRLSKRRYWFIILAISAAIILASFYLTCIQMSDLQILRDEENPNAGFLFNQGDALFLAGGFGLSIASIVPYFLFSMTFKYSPFCTNTRRTPF